MRRSRLFVWVVGLVLLCCAAGLAEEHTVLSGESTLTYRIETDGKTGGKYAVITAATAVPDLVIPGEVDGISVRTIGKKGMESILGRGINNTVETLTIEEGVQEIGDYAFFGLRQLRKAELPDSVTKIGGYAFSSCYVLSEVRFPKDLKASGIGAGAFQSTGFEDIVLPDGTSVAEYWRKMGLDGDIVFSTYRDGWDYLKLSDGTGRLVMWPGYQEVKDDPTVVVPEKLGDVWITEIGPKLFGAVSDQYRNGIEKVVLPEGLKVIWNNAFLRCEGLREINLPVSLESIGFAALAGVKAEGLELPENAREQSDAMWYCTTIHKDASGKFEYGILPDQTAVITAFTVEKNKQVTIPAEVDGVRVSMISQIPPNRGQGMAGYSELKNVEISEGIECIGPRAFEDCKSLSAIQLPKSLKVIGDSAFRYCEALGSIKLPNGLEEIGDEAFIFSGVKNLQIPDSVVRLGGTPFRSSGLTGVTLPLVSYGGSSVLSTLLMFSLVQGFILIGEKKHARTEKKQKEES